jgi:hypothetical protein
MVLFDVLVGRRSTCVRVWVQANIREEREAMTELGDLVMHRALTPFQAAVYIVESFPGRPDGFALVNAVAQSPGACPVAA